MPRPHIGYFHPFTKKRLAGVTTFTGLIWESYKTKAMLDWAQGLALEEPPCYHEWDRDLKGLIGSMAHELCIAHAAKIEADLSQFYEHPMYSSECLFKAEAYLSAFINYWRDGTTILEYEMPIINEEDEYGGCPDLVLNDVIADIKTGFVDEYSCALQLSAYAESHRIKDGKQRGGLIIGFEDIMGEKKVREYKFTPKDLQSIYPIFLAIKLVYYNKQQFNKGR